MHENLKQSLVSVDEFRFSITFIYIINLKYSDIILKVIDKIWNGMNSYQLSHQYILFILNFKILL